MIDEAVRLAREWKDISEADLVGAFSGDAWKLARAVLVLHEALGEIVASWDDHSGMDALIEACRPLLGKKGA